MPPSAGSADPESQRLQPNRSVSKQLVAGQICYFHLDVPTPTNEASNQSLTLRLSRDGGDPVLMASSGQWPVVDLDADDDMVRAHCCALDNFHADAQIHTLTVPDCCAARPPHPTLLAAANTDSVALHAWRRGAALVQASERELHDQAGDGCSLIRAGDHPTREHHLPRRPGL